MQGKNWPIAQLPRFHEQARLHLEQLGITTTQQLLLKAQTPQGKEQIAQQLDEKPQQVSKWIIMADLARIPSVGCQYCGLLLHGGISSIAQLSQMSPQKLHQQILRLHVKLFQRRDYCPSVAMVQTWIQQAKQFQ